MRFLHHNAPANSSPQRTVTDADAISLQDAAKCSLVFTVRGIQWLVPSSFYWRTQERGNRFQDDDEMNVVVEPFLKAEMSTYTTSIFQFINRWEECVTLCDTYEETNYTSTIDARDRSFLPSW